MKRIFILALFLIISLSNLNFAYSISPDVFIQSTVNRASQVLSKNLSKEEKINELKTIAKDTVDIRGVGYYSLGSARNNLSDKQQKIYFELFEKYFLKSFTSRLSDYSDPKIEVISAEVVNPKYEKYPINNKNEIKIKINIFKNFLVICFIK